MVWHCGQPEKMVLVNWCGMQLEESMWEFISDMVELYPNFKLEDKVFFPGVGDDTTGVGSTDELAVEDMNGNDNVPIQPRRSRRVRQLPAGLHD